MRRRSGGGSGKEWRRRGGEVVEAKEKRLPGPEKL